MTQVTTSTLSEPGIAVVTGAGSGIGRAVAQKLLALGWKVAVTGRRRDPLVETVQGFANRSLVVAADVSQETDVDRLFSEIVAKWSRVDLLLTMRASFRRVN